MATYTESTARALLEAALALTTKPTLPTEQVDLLMSVAASTDTLGDTVYTTSGLNRAAAVGWRWKSGIVTDQYDLGGGPGKTLTRSQWYAHCVEQAVAYGSGAATVDGSAINSGRGIGSFAIVSSMAVES